MEIIEGIFRQLPPAILFLVIMGYGLLAVEAGVWVRVRKDRKLKEEKSPAAGSILGSLLGLLAFMLGFTFSMTASRYSERKHLVMEQAKAIETCYLRTSFLPDSQKVATRRILYQYVDMLIDVTQSPSGVDGKVKKLEDMQQQIWTMAVTARKMNMDPHLHSLYVNSVNAFIDIFGERKAVVLIFRIPAPIWATLVLLFGLSQFVVGLENSSFRLLRTLNIPIVTAAFSLIVTLISAMDSSARPGSFSVNQQPLEDVRHNIKENKAY